MTAGAFAGFPADSLEFYAALEADNSKVFWQANKARYEASVRGPMESLLAAVDGEFGPFHIFRPYNDVRFSKNKAPYKTAIGAVSESQGGSTYYVQFSGRGLMAGCGLYHMASDQLDRFRRAVDDDARGSELVAIVQTAEKAGYTIGAMEELKTAPRGYPKDHPRISLIRRKGLIASRSWPVVGWLHTRKAGDRVVDCWRSNHAVTGWLDTHVGPSTLPPPDAGSF